MSKNAPSGRVNSLSKALCEMAPEVVLVRVFPQGQGLVTQLYSEDFFQIMVSLNVRDDAARLVRRHFGNLADWRHAHDFHVPTGRLFFSPHPLRTGWIPQDDWSFGLLKERYVATARGGNQ